MKTKKFLNEKAIQEQKKKDEDRLLNIGVKKPKALLSREEVFKRVGLSQANIRALDFINSDEAFTIEVARNDFA